VVPWWANRSPYFPQLDFGKPALISGCSAGILGLELSVNESMTPHCHPTDDSTPTIGGRLRLVSGVFVGALAVSWLPALNEALLDYLSLVWWAVAIGMLAGVATDYTEIGLLWSNIGKRTALFLPLITVPQILICAVLLNTYVTV
jgi:hypothetical protein